MKNFNTYLGALFLLCLFVLPPQKVNAGNKDRSGEAGAPELLINPWTRSSGWGGVNVANVSGLEGIYNNVAGLAFTTRTEVIFSYTDWLRGSDISIISAGISQRVGDAGVIGISGMSMSFGDIAETTPDLPEGTGAVFSPSFLNVSLSYAKSFSNSIYGGLTLKVINEAIADARALGVAIDAGIQYVTGEQENIKFGISLRNIGDKIKFSGDGYSLKTIVPGQDNQFTTMQRSAAFELPTQLNIGAAYDFLFDDSRFTIAGNFSSNSFTKDQIIVGTEYSFKNYVQLRAGYSYEDGLHKSITDPERSNANRGFSGGFSVQIPMDKNGENIMGIDYSYRPTSHFSNIHSIGIRFSM